MIPDYVEGYTKERPHPMIYGKETRPLEQDSAFEFEGCHDTVPYPGDPGPESPGRPAREGGIRTYGIKIEII